MKEKTPKERFATLTEREREVLLLVCQHVGQQEIADEFVLSINTIKRHMFNIHNKLGLHDHKKTERVLALHNIYCPLFSESDESAGDIEEKEIIDLVPEPVQKSEPEMESAPIAPDEEEIIDSDEEEIIIDTLKPKKGGKEKMGTGKGRKALRLVLVLIVVALLAFGGWQGLKWFSNVPIFSSASAYEIREWHKEGDVWIQLADYEVARGFINLDFEIWNKTDQDLYFSWSPEQNFSMVDNENNRYDVFEASTREVTVGKDERLKFTGHGYSTVQFNDDPLYNSGVTDLYITMEYLSEIDKAVFHIAIAK